MSSISNSSGQRSVLVGVALDGTGWHPAAWREADSGAEALFTLGYWEALIGLAERAGIDFVTIEDALRLQSQGTSEAPDQSTSAPAVRPDIVEGRLDALLTASAVAPRTTRIGLIPTVTTTHTEPFHVGTGLQTLDLISLGRAGWQLKISAEPAAEANFGRGRLPEIDSAGIRTARSDPGIAELLEDASDTAEVARRLWDSWEDDAVIRDAASGRFLDRNRVHHIRFEGARFSVVGPSIVPRSPQGQIPVTLLSHSPQVHGLAVRVANVVFVTPENAAKAAGSSRGKTADEIVREVRDLEVSADRERRGLAPLRIVADLVIGLDAGETGGASESAAERLSRLDALAGSPFVSDARIFVGSASGAADFIEAWVAAGVDGVRLRPLALPTDLVRIADNLLPELVSRGLRAHGGPKARSLREVLGLAPAVNRYATERETTDSPDIAIEATKEAVA